MIKKIMERKLKEAMSESESGFTLIELLVVMLIIGILLAIAIPTFLGVINTAHNTSAQSNLGNAIIEANAIYTQDSQAFGGTSDGAAGVSNELNIMEPSLVFYSEVKAMTVSTAKIGSAVQVAAFDCAGTGLASTNTGCQAVVMSAFASQSGTCYYVVINKDSNIGTFALFGLNVPGAGTYYAAQSSADAAGSMASCALDGLTNTLLGSSFAGQIETNVAGTTNSLPTTVGGTPAGSSAVPVAAKGTSSGQWQSGQFPS